MKTAPARPIGARFHSAWRVRPALWKVGDRLDLVGSDEQDMA